MAKIPDFRFWILRRSSAQNKIRRWIGNRKIGSLDHPIRSCEHTWRNGHPNLMGRLQLTAKSNLVACFMGKSAGPAL
jgi:hypothetical protein